MSTRIRAPSTGYWPPDVLEFAARRQVIDLLDPLRLSLDRLFPALHSVRVRLEVEVAGERGRVVERVGDSRQQVVMVFLGDR